MFSTEKQKEYLVTAGMMSPNDTLLNFFRSKQLVSLIHRLGKWRDSWVYFTEEKIIVLTGIVDTYHVIIPYKNICGLNKSFMGVFPVAISIIHENPEIGDSTVTEFTVPQRDKWMSFIESKAGKNLTLKL